MTKPTSHSIIHTQPVPIQQNSLILDMPFDVFLEIFNHMGVQELASCQFVCHLWNQILRNEVVCQQLLKNHFPFYCLPKEINNFKETYQDQCRLHLNLINKRYAEYPIDLDLGRTEVDQSGIIERSPLFISGKTLYSARTPHSGAQSATIKIWDLDTKACEGTFDVPDRVSSLVIWDRKLFCSGHWSGLIEIWDLDTKTRIGALNGHKREVLCLTLSGRNLFSGSVDKTIKIWNLDTNSCMATLEGEHKYPIWSLAASGSELYSGSQSDDGIHRGMINIWDLNTKTRIGTIKDGLHGRIFSLLIFDGKLYSFFFSHALNATIKIWDLNTRECIQTFDREEVKCITRLTFPHAILNGKLCSFLNLGSLGSNTVTVHVWDFRAEYNTIFEALAGQLESNNSEISNQAMQRFSRMPKREKNKIYGELYKILKPFNLIPNDYCECGEHAFHEIMGQSSPSLEKAQAIRNYLQKQLKEDSHPLLIALGIVSSHDYSTKLGCRPADLERVGIISTEDLKIICSLSPAIQVLALEEGSGTEENLNFRDDTVKAKADKRKSALSNLSQQLFQEVTSKIRETNTCGVLLYEGECPWIGFQNRLSTLQTKFDAIVLECKGLPKLTVEAFKSAKYNELANELNALVGEFHILDRDHQIAKLHTYIINQWGVFRAWTNLKARGIQSLSQLMDSDQAPQNLFQMGE